MINSQHSDSLYFIISHSHWDRAWYQSFQSYRYRLVGLIDRLITLLNNDPEYRCFVLDGQTVLIDDYLEIRPQNVESIRKLVSEGRLIIGPWYVLPDLFLVSGESIIRNFQYARKMAEKLGGYSKTGYVPDPFGHWAQLPQIASKLGLNGYIFMRGMPIDEAERLKLYFKWVAPNGDSINALYLKEGYFNASALGYPETIGRFDFTPLDFDTAQKQIQKSIQKIKETENLPVIPLFNGMDHMPEQPEIPEISNHLNRELKGTFKQTSTDDLMQTLQRKAEPTQQFSGDLLGNAHHPILSSVFSTRIYLKQQNHHAQSLLEKYVEPISTIRHLLSLPPPDHQLVDYTWKELLKNHPHDDICGCSIDSVHRDNELRFEQVRELADVLITDTLEALSKQGFNESLHNDCQHNYHFLFNPHPFEITQTINTEIFFPNPDGEFGDPPKLTTLTASDFDGNRFVIEIHSSKSPAVKSAYVNNIWGRFYDISFTATLPSLGYKIITFKKETNELILNTRLESPPDNTIENDIWEVRYHKNNLTIQNKALDRTLQHPIAFRFQTDIGDTYSFGPIKDEEPIFSTITAFERSDSNKAKITFQLTVPESYQSTSAKIVEIIVFLTLKKSQIQLDIAYENRVRDGRLQLILNSGMEFTTSFADGHFRIADREPPAIQTPESEPDRYNAYPGELNYTTLHQGDFVIASTSNYSFWVANRGNPEFEHVTYNQHTHFAITLHRSVGKLSVANGRIRRVHAGPSIETPEAHCLRPFNFAFAFGLSNCSIPEIAAEARVFSHPLLIKSLPTFKSAIPTGKTPVSAQLLSISNRAVVLSSFRYTAEGIILRLYNSGDKTEQSDLFVGLNLTKFQYATLWDRWDESSATHALVDGSTKLTIKPHDIITLILR